MIVRILKTADWLAATARSAGAPGFLALAFHAVLPQGREPAEAGIDPYQPLAFDELESLIGALAAQNALFVDSDLLETGPLPRDRLAVWLTFDDGYANNLALPALLARYGARATVFVATDFVERGRSYWWDVFHREMRARNVSPQETARRRDALKPLSTAEIEARLAAEFGADCLSPRGELDRPMTPEEVGRLAREPTIEIGNHTHTHPLLTTLTPQAVTDEIAQCQARIRAWTGETPRAIAYPSGDFDCAVVEAARRTGLRYGLTCLATRETEPRAEAVRLAIGRVTSLRNRRMERELAVARSPLGLLAARATTARAALLSKARAGVVEAISLPDGARPPSRPRGR